jgi:hypothetical protein
MILGAIRIALEARESQLHPRPWLKAGNNQDDADEAPARARGKPYLDLLINAIHGLWAAI